MLRRRVLPGLRTTTTETFLGASASPPEVGVSPPKHSKSLNDFEIRKNHMNLYHFSENEIDEICSEFLLTFADLGALARTHELSGMISQNPSNLYANIVQHNTHSRNFSTENLPGGLCVSKDIVPATVDSGACDSIAPIHTFPHTHVSMMSSVRHTKLVVGKQ